MIPMFGFLENVTTYISELRKTNLSIRSTKPHSKVIIYKTKKSRGVDYTYILTLVLPI